MHRYLRIVLSDRGAHETRDIGIRAAQVIRDIPGVLSAEVHSEDADSTIVAYVWNEGSPRFQRTDEVLGNAGLRRDWDWDPLTRA